MIQIPKRLDTPEKQQRYLEVCRQINQYKAYEKHYKKELSNAKKTLERVQRTLKELRAFRDYIAKGGKPKEPKQGWLNFEEET